MGASTLNLKVLRPLANMIALSISPWQTASVLNEHGFKGEAHNPAEAEEMLVKSFEILDNEGKTDECKAMVEELFTLFGRMATEKQNLAFQTRANELLHHGYFHLAFHISNKAYLLFPFEPPVKQAVIRAQGLKEEDLIDNKRRIAYDAQTGKGSVDAAPFQLTYDTAEYKLFTEAWSHRGEMIKRPQVAQLIGHHKEGEQDTTPASKILTTRAINKVVTKLRAKTGLTRDEFILSGGSVTIVRR